MHPRYACAIVHDHHGRLLLERRPPAARHAAGRLTCFGGRREHAESWGRCLLRELGEELGWRALPRRPAPAVDLWIGAVWMARFASLPVDDVAALLPAPRAVHCAVDALASAPISRWHRTVLVAWRRRERLVRLAR